MENIFGMYNATAIVTDTDNGKITDTISVNYGVFQSSRMSSTLFNIWWMFDSEKIICKLQRAYESLLYTDDTVVIQNNKDAVAESS